MNDTKALLLMAHHSAHQSLQTLSTFDDFIVFKELEPQIKGEWLPYEDAEEMEFYDGDFELAKSRRLLREAIKPLYQALTLVCQAETQKPLWQQQWEQQYEMLV